MIGLSEQQLAILKLLAAREDAGLPVRTRDIALALGVCTKTAFDHLDALRRKACVSRPSADDHSLPYRTTHWGRYRAGLPVLPLRAAAGAA